MAANEYGEYDRRASLLYGLDMVVEPFKETTLTVLNPTEASESCKRSLTSEKKHVVVQLLSAPYLTSIGTAQE